jgi:hypothetical protein
VAPALWSLSVVTGHTTVAPKLGEPTQSTWYGDTGDNYTLPIIKFDNDKDEEDSHINTRAERLLSLALRAQFVVQLDIYKNVNITSSSTGVYISVTTSTGTALGARLITARSVLNSTAT